MGNCHQWFVSYTVDFVGNQSKFKVPRNFPARKSVLVYRQRTYEKVLKRNLELYMKSSDTMSKNKILVADEIKQSAFGENR